jgi:hypothetical protein
MVQCMAARVQHEACNVLVVCQIFLTLAFRSGAGHVEVSLADIKNADILIGTSCCGTGIDLDSVQHVIICGQPYSIEQLLQWAGRCRSDGLVSVIMAHAHMLQATELSGVLTTLNLKP